MNDLLATLAASDLPIMEVLFASAVVLILVDYFFPVDFPAYVGYLCFALGMFWVLPFGPLPSLVGVLVIFALFLLLHRAVFSRFLTNAPSAERLRRRS
jgi:membrane protein implicated in regulation of membrane protease activity